MIDIFNLGRDEGYEFQTDGGHYVVVVNVGTARVQVFKGNSLLASLDRFETYSCPSNTGPYRVFNPSTTTAHVLLVRYILI